MGKTQLYCTTKGVLFLCICLFLCSTIIYAQDYYYHEPKTFYENGYTYQCDKEVEIVATLYNKENQYTHVEWAYKDGTPIDDENILMGYAPFWEHDLSMELRYDSIVNNAFSPEEKQQLKNSGLMVCTIIDTNTGMAREVEFQFRSDNGFGKIPVRVYRKLETTIVEMITYKLTETGRKLNYIEKCRWFDF